MAGTKGKGSTSALLASVLRAAGRRTGLYTSPHVSSAFERIAIAGEPPRPDLLVRLGSEVKACHRGAARGRACPAHYAPTTFELLTLLAFLYFREGRCDEAVIEMGIGGRLDATNVVSSEASVITPLDLEHTDILGDTLEKIAFEKAGIIKPGDPGLHRAAAAGRRRRCSGRSRRSAARRARFLDEEAADLAARTAADGTTLSFRLPGEPARQFRSAAAGGVPGGERGPRLSHAPTHTAGDHPGQLPGGIRLRDAARGAWSCAAPTLPSSWMARTRRSP